jgi:hypothetical protein
MVMAIVDAADPETTAQYERRGCVPRTRKVADKDDHMHATEGTIYGWKLIVLIDVRTKPPLAVTADDWPQAIVGKKLTTSCWVHAMRHRQGRVAYNESDFPSSMSVLMLFLLLA